MSILIQIGDRVVAPKGSAYQTTRGVCEVIGLHDDMAWLLDEHGKRFEAVWPIVESMWEKPPTFFRFGKTYKFASRDATWEILDIYEVDDPIHHRLKAIARMVDGDGKEDIQALDKHDFSCMVEA
jgi:hypothetical protein